jgi:CHAT domain-containing protein
MIGLSNAFLVAGACTVGSTLWNVGDTATATLMTRFYEELKKGVDVASAMRAAQNHLRSFAQWSHPLYWAPFRIAGSFSNPFDHLIIHE